jgi:hypothetical protein
MTAQPDLDLLYQLLDQARRLLGGFRHLRDPQRDLPQQGVYFFFDEREPRASGDEARIIRVGTHALKAESSRTLSNRLGQHRGALAGRHPGGGNHRGSVFRLHVGKALIAKGGWSPAIAEVWGVNQPRGFRADAEESALERVVSDYIRALPFVWVPVVDKAGPDSVRGVIEKGAIALLSNQRHPIDTPSRAWLGLSSPEPKIRSSGLWNVHHVEDPPTAGVLRVLDSAVLEMGSV